MIRSTVDAGDFSVDLWEDPATSGHVSQDASLVTHRNGILRVAAIDGCSLSRPLRHARGVDGGIWAAAMVRTALLVADTPVEALRLANMLLHDPSASTPRDLPQACVIVADLVGTCPRILRAGDCEAWVAQGGIWKRLFDREIRTAASASEFRSWTEAHPGATADERYDAEVALWALPSAWHTAAIGRFPDVMLQACDVTGFDELVLATDGARLDGERLAALDAWLCSLRMWERNNLRSSAGGKIHDDLVVLRARRRST